MFFVSRFFKQAVLQACFYWTAILICEEKDGEACLRSEMRSLSSTGQRFGLVQEETQMRARGRRQISRAWGGEKGNMQQHAGACLCYGRAILILCTCRDVYNTDSIFASFLSCRSLARRFAGT